MEARHIFVKGAEGQGVFYRLEDFLVYYSITSIVAKEMGLTVLAFCPMFNHIHFLLESASLTSCRQFIQKIAIIFVKEYNDEYGRKGSLFQKPFGSSRKSGVKIILGCIAYIFNNPVAGKLCKRAMDYRWNLAAYYNNNHPFSKRIWRKECRAPMRRALSIVDSSYSCGRYLTYGRLREILKDLNPEELHQITDYIISKYNFLSYSSLEALYGSYGNMRLAIDANAGSEYEIDDEYGDHSCYRKMLLIVQELGYKGRDLNFELLSQEERTRLANLISKRINAPMKSINKFLHRKNGGG